MPREPLPSAVGSAAPSPAVARSRAINEPLVNRYSLRCASIVASRRRYHSRSIAKCSFSSSRLCARSSLSSPSLAASTRWSYQSAASSSSCMDVSARWLSSVSGLSLLSDSWYPTEFAIAAPLGTGVPMHRSEVERSHDTPRPTRLQRQGPHRRADRALVFDDDERTDVRSVRRRGARHRRSGDDGLGNNAGNLQGGSRRAELDRDRNG